jgi:hypothetical protein
VTPDERRDLGRRFAAARRRVAEAGGLVEVASRDGRRRWRSTLPAEEVERLERRAATALASDDAEAARESVRAMERFAIGVRARRTTGNPLADLGVRSVPKSQRRGR